jgi:hypothetical protein
MHVHWFIQIEQVAQTFCPTVAKVSQTWGPSQLSSQFLLVVTCFFRGSSIVEELQRPFVFACYIILSRRVGHFRLSLVPYSSLLGVSDYGEPAKGIATVCDDELESRNHTS